MPGVVPNAPNSVFIKVLSLPRHSGWGIVHTVRAMLEEVLAEKMGMR